MECGLQMGFQIERIVVLAGDNTGRSDDIAVLVHNRQDVAGLAFLAALIGDRLTAFLSQAVRTVQVQF